MLVCARRITSTLLTAIKVHHCVCAKLRTAMKEKSRFAASHIGDTELN